jgi:O-6-methylguanine DNA methyltransferase
MGRSKGSMIQISSQERDGVWFSLALNERGQSVACAFSDRSQSDAERVVKNAIREGAVHAGNDYPAASKRFQDLYDILEGKGEVKIDSLDLSNVSEFRRKVYSVLSQVPRGHVTTYGAIAKKLGSRRYARAVGTAVADNPLPLLIPCHRVVPSSHKVGNYGMPGRQPSEGGYMKRKILEREGVKFQANKVVKESLWTPK